MRRQPVYREKTGNIPEKRPLAGVSWQDFPFDNRYLGAKRQCQKQGFASLTSGKCLTDGTADSRPHPRAAAPAAEAEEQEGI
jgi:hypothetical protein